MKKRFLFFVMFLMVCAGGFAQTDVDVTVTWSLSNDGTLTFDESEEICCNPILKWISDAAIIKKMVIREKVTNFGIDVLYFNLLLSNLTSITVDAGNPSYSSEDGVLFNKDKTELIACPRRKAGAYTIPNSVTMINSQAFLLCNGLTSIQIPSSVNYSDNSSLFVGCSSLTSISVDANNPSLSVENGVLFNKDKTTLIDFPAGKSGTYTVPNSVTKICDSAFWGCSGLTSITVDAGNPNYSSENGVLFNKDKTTLIACPAGKSGAYTIPNSVKTINSQAFVLCSSLTSIHIPSSVNDIRNVNFSSCTSLMSISVDADNPNYSSEDGVLYNKDKTTIYDIPEGKSTYTFPSSITQISSSTFPSNNNLTSIIIPSWVTSISQSAFGSNLSIITVADDNNYFSSENGVLFNKNKTTLIACTPEKTGEYTIPNSVTTIESYAFDGCSSLTSINIPNSVNSVGENAFRGTILENGQPNGVIYIGNVLYGYKGTMPANTTIDVRQGITTINGNVFKNCTGLISITIPNSVKAIDRYTFDGCINLQSITLPYASILSWGSNIRHLMGLLFHYESGNIPDYIRQGDYPCYIPASMKTVTLNDEDEISLGSDFFRDCSGLTEIRLSKSIKVEYEFFSGCTNLKFLTLPLKYYRSSYFGGSLSGNSSYLPASLQTVTITDDATIKDNFFQNCANITKVTARDATIGNNVFSGCSKLDTLIVGKATGALGGPTALKYFSIVDKTLQSLPSGLLANCESLTEVILPAINTLGGLFGITSNNNMQSVVQQNPSGQNTTFYMPKNLAKLTVTSASEIAFGAFYNCSMLKEITLGSTIKGLGEKALYGCNGLEHIYSQWAYPPTAYTNSTFEAVNKFACIIHVPTNSKQYYSVADGWKEFFTIQEEAPIKITVKSVPINCGVSNGLTEYERNETATPEAIGNSGYDFQGWMEGSVFVSASRIYHFTALDSRTLYAVFTPRENENSVEITAHPTDAAISWDGEAGASSYTLIIYSDAARTQEFARFEFDANGTLRAGGRMSHTVGSLSVRQPYYYAITSLNNEGEKISIAVGNFTTPSATGMDEVFASPAKELTLYPNPLRNGETAYIAGVQGRGVVSLLSLNGNLLRSELFEPASGEVAFSVGEIPAGVYLVRIVTDKEVKTLKAVVK